MTLVTEQIGLSEYLKLSRELPGGWIYHKKEWISSLTEGFNGQFLGLLTRTSMGSLLAVTPFIKSQRFFLRLVGAPLRGMYTEFSGPLFGDDVPSNLRQNAVVSQHHYIRKSVYAPYIEWGTRGGLHIEPDGVLDCLVGLGYEYVPRPTLTIDLSQGIEPVWAGFESRARNMVRKAEKQDITVSRIEPMTESDVTCYYKMLSETFHRQGRRPPHPISFFQAIRRNLGPGKMIDLFVAKKDGEAVAAGIFLRYSDRMVYLSGTATELGLKFAASSLVQWSAHKYATELRILEYDFGGIGAETIDKFKYSFGGKPVTHSRWIYRSPTARFAERCYQQITRRR